MIDSLLNIDFNILLLFDNIYTLFCFIYVYITNETIYQIISYL